MNTTAANNGFNINDSTTYESAGFSSNGMAHFREYAAQLAIPEVAGTRIVKCLYKENQKTKVKAGVNSYVRVPALITETEICSPETLAKLVPYFVDYLEDKEDEMIKDWHKKGVTGFGIADMGITKLLAWMEESIGAGRLNSEKIAVWFSEVLEQPLITAFAEKLGLPLALLSTDTNDAVIEGINGENVEKLAKLEKIVEAYKEKFCSLASPKVVFKEADCTALVGILTRFECTDSISLRFVERLEKMKLKVDDLLALL